KLPSNWHAVGPGAVCPFTNGNDGFTCTTEPTNGSPDSKSNSKNVVPSSGTYKGYICPSDDANSHTYYNGCWTSEPTTANLNGQKEPFCTGSSCACPKDSSNSNVSGCSCSTTGGTKVCSGFTYIHNWTQPSVTAPVGFTNRQWTSSNSTPTVANN